MPNLPSGARYLSLPQVLRPNTPAFISNVDSNGLFSPCQPVAPLNPSGEYFRSRQIVPGENLIWQPKGDEILGFWILREFADSCDLLRIVINTILDRLASIPWEIKLKPNPGEKVKDLQARQSNDPRVAALTKLFLRPDGVHSYADWTRMLWEDITVIDAGVIYKERDLKGRIANLRPLDGGTFNVLVTEQGFRPEYPNPSNQQVLYGIPWFNATTQDITYIMRNPRTWKRYGFSAVEQIFVTVGIALQRQQFMSAYYTSGNIPEAMCFLPSDMPIDRVKEVQEWFDTVLAGDLSKRRRLTFLPGYGKQSESSKPNVIFPKEVLLKDPCDEWLFQMFCYHLGTSPQAMLKMANRATAQQNQESSEEEGMLPRMLKHKSICDDIIQSDIGYIDIEFAYQERREMDLLKQAQIDQIYVGEVVTINEVRADLGKDPIKVPEADMLGEFTPNGFVPLAAAAQADRAGQMADAVRDPDPEPTPAPGKKKPGAAAPSKKKATTSLLEKRLGARIDPAKVTHETERARIAIRGHIVKVFQRQKDKAKEEVSRLLKLRTTSKQSSRHPEIHPAGALMGRMRKDDDSYVARTPEEIADAIYAVMDEQWKNLPPQIHGAISSAVLTGFNDGLIQIEISDAGLIAAANDVAEEYARDRSAAMVGMKYDADGILVPNPNAQWQISQTTRDRIKQIVDDSFKAEAKMSDVEDSIQDALADEDEGNGIFSEARADMIARTETSNALVQGNLDVWKKSGIVTKVAWLLSNDHEGEDECDDFAEDSPYDLLAAPVPIVDTHPNCSCTLSVVEVSDSAS